MSFEIEQQPTTRLETLLEAIKQSPETFDDLEASMLFLDAEYFDFKDAMLKLGKKGRKFSLVFVMDDMGKTEQEKKMRLRQLKAMREDFTLRNVISKIIVKGKPGDESIEPNVFSSDVTFVADNA